MSGRMSSAERGSERLSARRRKKRQRMLLMFAVIFVLLVSALIWGVRQNAVCISHVNVFGADTLSASGKQESLATIATAAMQGNYFYLVPRSSTFFFPETKIRADLLVAHPDVAAVSMFRNGLTGLSINVAYRVPVARWCGSTFATSSPSGDCYLFDANGFIFSTTSAMTPINSFRIFEPINNSPIGSTLPNALAFPAAFNFARQLTTFGSPVSSIVFRTDEVDDYLASGTRVTYVLGDEQDAFTALASARANFNLADGSGQYVDLRFDGKINVKKNE